MRRLVRLENLQEMKPFDCGDDDLNGFLLDDARFYYKELIANTFVMENENEIVAYFSLLNDKISQTTVSKNLWRKLRKTMPHRKHLGSYPAMKIGRLAISLKEFQEANSGSKTIKRYDRTKYLKLPKIDFYQLRVNYITQQLEAAAPERDIPKSGNAAKVKEAIIKTTDLTMQPTSIQVDDTERGTTPATFSAWLLEIVKGSFGTLSMAQLKPYEAALKTLFENLTFERDGSRYYSSKYDRSIVEANVRKAFCDRRSFTTSEELIPQESRLLRIENFTATATTTAPESYYPNQGVVERIIQDDKGKLKVDANIQKMMQLAKESGNTAILNMLQEQNSSHPQKNRSFHYLPYHTDSSFEQRFLEEVLAMSELEQLDLEVYYNGDRALTEFKLNWP